MPSILSGRGATSMYTNNAVRLDAPAQVPSSQPPPVIQIPERWGTASLKNEAPQEGQRDSFSFFSWSDAGQDACTSAVLSTPSFTTSPTVSWFGPGSSSPAHGLVKASRRADFDMLLPGEDMDHLDLPVPVEKRVRPMEACDITFPAFEACESVEDGAKVLQSWKRSVAASNTFGEPLESMNEAECLKKILEVAQAHKDRLLSQRKDETADAGNKEGSEQDKQRFHQKAYSHGMRCTKEPTLGNNRSEQRVSASPRTNQYARAHTSSSSKVPRPRTSSFWRAGSNPGPKPSPLPTVPKDSDIKQALLEKLKKARSPSSSL